jgi:hypothetical protein
MTLIGRDDIDAAGADFRQRQMYYALYATLRRAFCLSSRFRHYASFSIH